MKVGLLLVLLILSLVFLSLLAFVSQQLGDKAASTRTPITQPTDVPDRAFTTLTASSKAEVAVGESFPITISITTGVNLVTIVGLKLSYDPSLVSIENILPGDFLQDPIEYAKENDSEKGEIRYSIGSFEGRKGQGTLATIQARALKKTTGTVEVLTINSTSIVAELGYKKSVLKDTKGASVVIR